MTDSMLRELEHRFRASGGVDDEAAWHRARLQSGQLERGKLELAAHCGSRAAMTALGRLDLESFHPKATFFLVEPSLDAIEPEFAARCAICIGRLVDLITVQILRRVPRPNECDPGLLRQAVEDLEDWAVAPSGDGAIQLAQRFDQRTTTRLKVDVFAFLARQVAVTARSPIALTDVSNTAVLHLNELFPDQGMRILREALSREVGPWLLGYADPLRERVEARQREATSE